jgi:thiol-disulfide isomerase/thioredoxin
MSNLLRGGFLLISAALSGAMLGQEMKFVVDGLGADTVYLANYFGDKMYYADTTVASTQGVFTFDAPAYEKSGKYAVILPGKKMFELIGVPERIEIKTSMAKPSEDIVVVDSDENKLFYDYLGFIQGKRKEASPQEAILQDSTSTEKERAAAMEIMNSYGDEVAEEQKRVLRDHGDKLFAKYLNMVVEPEIPEVPAQIANPRDLQYRWYRDHYWDRVDFSDPRMVHDAAFHSILNTYWTRVLPQIPDTLETEALKLIKRAEANADMFKYIVHYITFNSESSQVMCMDKVFVRMVNEFYRTGKAVWLNEDQIQTIVDRADDLKHSLCGNRPPNITLPDISQENWVSLYDIDAKYTAIVIWESTCGHCKKELPKLQKLYEEWKPKGLEIFAIGNDFEPEPWIKFLNNKGYTDWINVSDNPLVNAQDSAMKLISSGITTLESLNFRTTFDVYATPKVFLLDEDKKIVAKQIGTEQLGEILGRLEAMESASTEGAGKPK